MLFWSWVKRRTVDARNLAVRDLGVRRTKKPPFFSAGSQNPAHQISMRPLFFLRPRPINPFSGFQVDFVRTPDAVATGQWLLYIGHPGLWLDLAVWGVVRALNTKRRRTRRRGTTPALYVVGSSIHVVSSGWVARP